MISDDISLSIKNDDESINVNLLFSSVKGTRIVHLQRSWRTDEKRAPVWKVYSDFTIWTHYLCLGYFKWQSTTRTPKTTSDW